MLRNTSEKLPPLHLTTLNYTMVKRARLDDAFSEIFELEAVPSRRSITEAKRKDNEKSLKTYVAFSLKTRSFYFCACPSKNVEKRFECL